MRSPNSKHVLPRNEERKLRLMTENPNSYTNCWAQQSEINIFQILWPEIKLRSLSLTSSNESVYLIYWSDNWVQWLLTKALNDPLTLCPLKWSFSALWNPRISQWNWDNELWNYGPQKLTPITLSIQRFLTSCTNFFQPIIVINYLFSVHDPIIFK